MTSPADDGVDAHGRDAERPASIPTRGWKDVLVRTRQEVKDDRVPLLAAGVAFYALLAMVPARWTRPASAPSGESPSA